MEGRQLRSHDRRIPDVIESGEHDVFGYAPSQTVKNVLQIRRIGIISADERIWAMLLQVGTHLLRVRVFVFGAKDVLASAFPAIYTNRGFGAGDPGSHADCANSIQKEVNVFRTS